MRKFVLAALVAFTPATSFALAPLAEVGQRAVSAAPLIEVGCKWKKKKGCNGDNHGAQNRVRIEQRNDANVGIESGGPNNVLIDQRNQADVDINGGQNSPYEVYIYQQNKANVHIR